MELWHVSKWADIGSSVEDLRSRVFSEWKFTGHFYAYAMFALNISIL